MQLKDAGLDAYNHNLDTSREHYPKIITTRSYDDRLQTIANVRSRSSSSSSSKGCRPSPTCARPSPNPDPNLATPPDTSHTSPHLAKSP